MGAFGLQISLQKSYKKDSNIIINKQLFTEVICLPMVSTICLRPVLVKNHLQGDPKDSNKHSEVRGDNLEPVIQSK